PVVYNSGGYERKEIIKKLNNIIDVYMPDFKYSDPVISKKYSGISDYPEMAFETISEMFRQVGSLLVDENGIAVRGVIIRHLILPGHIKNSKDVLKKIGESNFRDAYLSLMSQFFPAYNASGDEHLKKRLKPEEYEEVKSFAISKGLVNGWFQDI
ncbi:MAG: radical SAM protein, partial [Candidatus Aminicenantes bacterium]|nr:radical SAM protein [Candidatus Aminicenantes bacterium]